MIKKRSVNVESRLTRLETEMGYIREQVENHIPTTLAEHGKTLETINRKMGDMDAISRFLSVCLKGLGVVWGAVMAVRQVMHWGK